MQRTHVTEDLQTHIGTLTAWTEARTSGSEPDEAADSSLEETIRVLDALGETAQPAVPALVRAMHADQRRMGALVGAALGSIGGDAAVRELNRIWYSGWDRALCSACHRALASLGERAHPTLLRLLDGGSPLEQVRALRSLRVSGYPQPDLVARAAPRLEAFESPTLESLIAFFGSIDDPAALPAAIAALQAMGGGQGVPLDHTRALASDVMLTLSERLAGR